MAIRDIAAQAVPAIDAVFGRVAAVSSLPYDLAAVVWFDEPGPHPRLVSSRGDLVAIPDALADQMMEERESSLVSRIPVGAETRSCIVVPLWVASEVVGAIGFVAAADATYDRDDVELAERVTETMVSLALPAVEEHDDPIDVSEEVLRELAHVLHVRDVFPRISAIVNRVLPHDRLTMTFHETDQVSLQLASLPVAQEFGRLKTDPRVLAKPVVHMPELTPEALRHYEPREAREYLLRSGFLSFLAINVRAREQRMGVEFWSKRAHAFTPADVRLARTIASYLAFAVSHEQLIGAETMPETVPRRAAGLEARVKKLIDRLDATDRHHATDQQRTVVGSSAVWKPVLSAAARVAETDATVLLMGESGTGKEVLARFIHSVSARSRGPFIGVNCAALPEQLLESELFGHERGAFTGATHTKPGQIELAAGGVLFLDEVTEMSMHAQAKFLRFLQEREFRRVGGTRLLKSDVQVIAATNADVQRSIHSGQFRRDLYYRLRVVDIRLPALRDRRDDIPLLTEALLDAISARLGIARPRLTPAALQALLHHRWPGNVRELRNVLERASILTDDRTIDVRDLSFDDDETLDDLGSSTHLGTIERDLIEKVLRECGGNKSLAAKRLGLSRMQLYVRLRRYDLPSETAH